jgi:hypothetical protein
MWHRLRRELLIELHTHGCAISRPARWPASQRRCEPLASGSGRGEQALAGALSNLRQASEFGWRIGQPVPLLARLVVSDEYVDYELLPGNDLPRVAKEVALRRAEHRFADRLGHENSAVAVSALPGSPDWLCAAIHRNELNGWHHILRSHGVQLAHVHPALVEDLRAVASRVTEGDAVLAFTRDEGVMLVRLAQGLPRQLAWERLDPDETAIVDWRLRAFAARTAPRPEKTRTVVYLVSRSRAVCRFVLESERPARPHLAWRAA